MRTEKVGDRISVTFVVTKDCNFRCRYCYMVGKHGDARMPFSVARDTVDYLVDNPDLFPQPKVVWDFIGGEPFLEIDLMEQIFDYIVLKTWKAAHPWFENSYFSVSTNGVLYHLPKVQRLIDQYGRRFEIGLTIDGPAHVHNLERVFPNGEGTHDQVVKNVGLWLQRSHDPSTKVTFSHDTIPYVAESILYLFSLGIPVVNANVVFEDVWQPGDDDLFEEQLNLLGDAIIDQGLWKKHECSLFSRLCGAPLTERHDTTWCGAGKHMLAVDANGLFYPCVRFTDFSLAKQPPIIIGNTQRGLDQKALEPFCGLTRSNQSSDECMSCEVAQGCAWCLGFNYDDSGVLYKRATYLCKMHKARVRANRRFWSRIDEMGDRLWKQAAAR
jgi:uncharacterized protein